MRPKEANIPYKIVAYLDTTYEPNGGELTLTTNDFRGQDLVKGAWAQEVRSVD